MKLQNLFASIVFFSLATGAGSAFAQDRCDGFYIQGKSFDSLTLDRQSCMLASVDIAGDLTVTNSDYFYCSNCEVGGNITVTGGGHITLIGSNAKQGRIILNGNEDVTLEAAFVGNAIRVIGNGTARVLGTEAPIIRCRDNTRTIGYANFAVRGNKCLRPAITPREF